METMAVKVHDDGIWAAGAAVVLAGRKAAEEDSDPETPAYSI